MLLVGKENSTQLICSVCGGPILTDQPFIERGGHPLHSESSDCHPEEGWNPHFDAE